MIYDVVIIGGGPGGLSAAIYASRSGLKTLLIEKNAYGGQVTMAAAIDNYPGFGAGISGFDLAVKLENQAKGFGAELICEEVVDIKYSYDYLLKKVITTESSYETKTVIIAAGRRVKEMNIPGESKFMGRGVSFCATCDAPFYKDKDILVVGGGDSAVQETVYLSKFAKSVTVVHRRNELRAAKTLQKEMGLCRNISVIYDTVVKEILGKSSIEKVTVTNIKTNENKNLNVSGVFVFIGLIPNTSFLSNVILDEVKYVVTDENMNTSIPGIFACGDIRKKQLRQIVTAASDGAQAAISARYYIETARIN